MSDPIDNDWRFRSDFPSSTLPEIVLQELIDELQRPMVSIKGCMELLSSNAENDIRPAVIAILDGSTQRVDATVKRVIKYLDERNKEHGNGSE